MTVRQRILSVYKNELPDQIPVSIYSAYLRYGALMREARNEGLGILDIVPGVSLLSPPYFATQDRISETKNASFNVSFKWVDGEILEIHRLETPVGTITEHVAKDPSYGSNWRRKHYIQSVEDYKIVQYAVENTVFRDLRKGLAQRKRDLGEDGVILSRLDRSPYQKLLIELAKPEQFLIDLFTDPEPVTELIEVMEHKLSEQVRLALESEADAVWSPDNVTSDMTPPDTFQKYCMPFYQKHYRACRESGKTFLVHMDGRVGALKELIAKSAFDVVDSFSFPEMHGDVTIPEARAAWPDKVVCPNFPSSFSTKPRKVIEGFLDRVFSEFGMDKPFMIQISEDIPLDSYEHLLPILTSYFRDRGKRG